MGIFRQDKPAGGRDNKQMHPAVCDKCGNKCEVPFKPTGDKPIFCSDCFKTNRPIDSKPRGGGGGGRGGDRQMFKAVCDKCGNDCEVPFRPTGNKPVYCSNCFEKTGGGGRGDNKFGSAKFGGGGRNDSDHQEFKRQFEILNSKLDTILASLPAKKASTTKSTSAAKPAAIKTVAKKPAKKVVAKKKAAKKK